MNPTISKSKWIVVLVLMIMIGSVSFRNSERSAYVETYYGKLDQLELQHERLLKLIRESKINDQDDLEKIRTQIGAARKVLKSLDFWLRYTEPVVYKKLNGPLLVEWETEVFEKFEKPYRREGAGLMLAEVCLDEEDPDKEALLKLISTAAEAAKIYKADSITQQLETYHHFFLSNRLFLLNLAAIYTTAFECPDTSRVIPELYQMLIGVKEIYQAFNTGFRETPLPPAYLSAYERMIGYVQAQPAFFSAFDRFLFIRDHVNPLYAMNQRYIRDYHVVSKSYVDYSLGRSATSIFSKSLYRAQNEKGIFLRVNDPAVLAEIEEAGKLLFYDPILSGNNERSCASCHRETAYFTGNATATDLGYDQRSFLPRNTPSLINAGFNHLLMADGKHYTLQPQTKGVVINPDEMGANENVVIQKVLSCSDYNRVFKKLVKHTPQEPSLSFDHIASAITAYYGKFSKYDAPFDRAMNKQEELSAKVKNGFNLFMGKAQCATCHFVPQFNGVKPPYTGSEFEVLGVPADAEFKALSQDKGRYWINPAAETAAAFRTGSLKNIAHTAPYMHNGVFKTLEEVIDFYDRGGGAGRGLYIENQTLSPDSLHLTVPEKEELIAFLHSLTEDIVFEKPPVSLPHSKDQTLNTRRVGGSY